MRAVLLSSARGLVMRAVCGALCFVVRLYLAVIALSFVAGLLLGVSGG